MKQYAVKTRFVFDGYFHITAETKAQAREYAEKHCGLVIGRGIHTTLPEESVDWDFPVHPDKTITGIKRAKKNRDISRPTIRFIDSKYRTLFFISDGGEIEIETKDGAKIKFPCRYIDEHHTKIGEKVYHITEFAQTMELYGSTCKPAEKQDVGISN